MIKAKSFPNASCGIDSEFGIVEMNTRQLSGSGQGNTTAIYGNPSAEIATFWKRF